MSAPEKAVLSECKRIAALMGYVVSDLTQPRATMQSPGLPDLYLQSTKHRVRLWVECKAGKNKLSPAQQEWHEAERLAGGNVTTVWSGADLHAYLTVLHEDQRSERLNRPDPPALHLADDGAAARALRHDVEVRTIR